MKIAHVMERTNWHMLAEQKLSLLKTIKLLDEQGRGVADLQGILHWIDAIQDAAEIDGFPVVFLEEK